MSRYATVTAEVDVEVCISEFDTEDLIDELEKRGRSVTFSYFQNNSSTFYGSSSWETFISPVFVLIELVFYAYK